MSGTEETRRLLNLLVASHRIPPRFAGRGEFGTYLGEGRLSRRPIQAVRAGCDARYHQFGIRPTGNAAWHWHSIVLYPADARRTQARCRKAREIRILSSLRLADAAPRTPASKNIDVTYPGRWDQTPNTSPRLHLGKS